MPMEKRTGGKAETERNFHEWRHGRTFSKTAKKHGRDKARKQMVAAVLSNQRKAKKRKKKRSSSRH